jgi:hypothetical protein
MEVGVENMTDGRKLMLRSANIHIYTPLPPLLPTWFEAGVPYNNFSLGPGLMFR